MASNPLGPGTKNLTVNVPEDLYVQLHRLAKKSGKRIGAYLREVLVDAAARQVVVRSFVESAEYIQKPETAPLAAEDPGNLPPDVLVSPKRKRAVKDEPVELPGAVAPVVAPARKARSA